MSLSKLTSYRLLYLHPESIFTCYAKCDNSGETQIGALVKSTVPPLYPRTGELRDLILLKPNDLPLCPTTTLPDRALDWLQRNLHHVINMDEHMDLLSSVADYFPDGPSPFELKQVEILLVDLDILECLDNAGDLWLSPAGVLLKHAKRKQYITLAPSPSDAVKDYQGLRSVYSGKHAYVHAGQPAGNFGLPPALFHPALAILDYHLQSLDQDLPVLEPDASFLENVHHFMTQCLDIYADGKEQLEFLRSTIGSILGEEDEWGLEQYKGVKPDIIWARPFVTKLGKVTNEFGHGGDAFLQAALSYGKIVTHPEYPGRSLNTNHPVILIGVMGDFIELGGVVFLSDGIYYSQLFSQRLCLDLHAHNHILHLAQAFKAVNIASVSIQDYYVHHRQDMATDSIAHLFPSPTAHPGDERSLPALTFCCRMRNGRRFIVPETSDDVSAKIYVASMKQPTTTPSSEPSHELPVEIDVVVKFTPRYNAEAHILLAKEGLAPKLHACQRVCGELYMVVMDLVPGQTMWQHEREFGRIPSTVIDDVTRAVDKLHKENIVFGDLRPPNVMCVSSPPESGPTEVRGMLIDFDWAGVAGKDRYPATVRDGTRDFVAGIVRCGLMQKEHDIGMLQKLSRFPW